MKQREQSGCLSIILIAIGVILAAFSWMSYFFGLSGHQLKKGEVYLPVFSMDEAITWSLTGAGLVLIAKALDLISYTIKKNKKI